MRESRAGGTTGYAGGSSLEEMARRSQHHFEIAKKIRSDVILLAHGAALVNPEDAQYLYQETDCHGIQLGSSIERMAIEEPLKNRAALFKAASASEEVKRLGFDEPFDALREPRKITSLLSKRSLQRTEDGFGAVQ